MICDWNSPIKNRAAIFDQRKWISRARRVRWPKAHVAADFRNQHLFSSHRPFWACLLFKSNADRRKGSRHDCRSLYCRSSIYSKVSQNVLHFTMMDGTRKRKSGEWKRRPDYVARKQESIDAFTFYTMNSKSFIETLLFSRILN